MIWLSKQHKVGGQNWHLNIVFYITKRSVVKDCLYIQDDFSQFMPAQVTVFDCFVHTLLKYLIGPAKSTPIDLKGTDASILSLGRFPVGGFAMAVT